ncbi:hypothetical protein [Frankia sp. AgB32]|uniref:hypothetical protein n=1 Tax=Frankia sp. AgB32 TaxID=631119 RepID=UPI00200FE420|nr:hypothetical protein [Frankia sp. AgB32]MCK9894727.1 hypothetical protein [Frankia sp. AgB32]
MSAQNRPVVALTNHDLISALRGNPIAVTDLDGNEVLLRLMTVGEAMRANRNAIESLAATMRAAGHIDWEGPEPMSRERVERLVEPLA